MDKNAALADFCQLYSAEALIYKQSLPPASHSFPFPAFKRYLKQIDISVHPKISAEYIYSHMFLSVFIIWLKCMIIVWFLEATFFDPHYDMLKTDVGSVRLWWNT